MFSILKIAEVYFKLIAFFIGHKNFELVEPNFCFTSANDISVARSFIWIPQNERFFPHFPSDVSPNQLVR